ncbi:MAG TPA: hypothetical protein VK211_05425 [Kamptonema sp.]|nr:hypothetical protein [Kamptonema sp.]
MNAMDKFWDLLLGAIAINPEAFSLIKTLPLGEKAAVYIVLLAGFSQAVGQAIVLFINRVKPFRFILSLLIATILFAFGYIFWATTTWLASQLLFSEYTSYLSVARTLGLAYAPLTLSFFVALPYLGVPLSVLLSIWSFLAFLTGLKIALGIGLWQAFWCGVLGWLGVEVLQRTVGRPVAAAGRWVANTAAGVNLVTDLKDLEKILETGEMRSAGANSINPKSKR